MTRRRDLMCEDLFGCDHTPETPIVEDGAVLYWVCRCGRKHPAPVTSFACGGAGDDCAACHPKDDEDEE